MRLLLPTTRAHGLLLIALGGLWAGGAHGFKAPALLPRSAIRCGRAAQRSCPRMVLDKSQGGPKSTPLGGAWDEGTGGRSKAWFEETERERREKVNSVLVRHILVDTRGMADELLESLKGGADFEELARSISSCAETRAEGGQVGWVGKNDEFLEPTLPEGVRAAALVHKPGDVVVCESVRGVHLVKVEDVMEDFRVSVRPRTRPLKGKGLLRPLRQMMDREEGYQLKYSIETMGCQMNSADSERMAGQLEAMGITRTELQSEANVVILNTCSIRDKAEQKVYSALGAVSERKRSGETVAVVVAGCVAQQEGERLLRRVPEVDLVMGPQYANRIGDLLEDVINGNQVVATEATRIMEDPTKPRRESGLCAWVNIIYGCNERCTYCVVPTTRGVEQSRSLESIRKEMRDLVASGYREVTLLGQNIDAWGRDMVPKQKFSDLLLELKNVEGIERIRFVTSHPRYMSLSVVEAVATGGSLCEMFHVPFQSGDDTILKAMGRGHTVEQYMKIVNRIRTLLPDAAITADAIVGFPGETEEQFENTLKLMEAVKFDLVNTAAYSPRPNTPAANWEGQLSEEVKADRLQQINRLGTQHALERSERYVGRTLEVFVEERNVKIPTQVKGRIRQGRPVYLDGDIDELKGKLVDVEIFDAGAYYLVGRQVGNPPR